jgi:DNA-binding NarL/FixJ family response regulator
MAYVARGELNKIIAAELGVSRRTIETHRARIFQKMQVRNAVQLTRRILGEPPKG